MRKLFLIMFISFFSVTASARSIHIETNPIGFLVGIKELRLSFALGNTIALGAMYADIDYEEEAEEGSLTEGVTTQNGSMYGAMSRFYLTGNAIESSLILTGYIGKIDTDIFSLATACLITCASATASAKVDGNWYAALLGYLWQGDHGLNISLSGGFVNYDVDVVGSDSSAQSIDIPLKGSSFAIDIGVGVAF